MACENPRLRLLRIYDVNMMNLMHMYQVIAHIISFVMKKFLLAFIHQKRFFWQPCSVHISFLLQLCLSWRRQAFRVFYSNRMGRFFWCPVLLHSNENRVVSKSCVEVEVFVHGRKEYFGRIQNIPLLSIDCVNFSRTGFYSFFHSLC